MDTSTSSVVPSAGPTVPKASSKVSADKVATPEVSVDMARPSDVSTREDRASMLADVQSAVNTLRSAIDFHAPSVRIGYDSELSKTLVTVVDAETNELIREIPSEEVLAIARYLERHGVDAVGSESLRGMLLDEMA